MFGGKNKAFTLSFDDGVTQDIRFIEILNKYGLKATFNINSELLGKEGHLDVKGLKINHTKVDADMVREIYKGHEIAAHTLTHPMLPTLDKAEIIRQVDEDRKNLEVLAGYEIVGMAYPGGGINNDDRVAEIIKNNTPLKYARTIAPTYNFDLQENLFRFNPTVHYKETDKAFELAKEFISLKCDEPKVFYVWGHSYELDIEEGSWERFDEFCRLISGHDDIFYGTNREILINKGVQQCL